MSPLRRELTSVALQARKATSLVRVDGTAELRRRVARRTREHFAAPGPDLPLASGDIADSTTLTPWSRPSPRPRGSSLDVGWVTTPPGAGSGGHTTMFRYVAALEDAGHRCVLYLYDRHGSDLRHAEHVVRTWWPHVRAEVRDVRDGIRGTDAVVATSWTAAHVLARRPDSTGHRFYLVQDVEPWFYGRSAESVLAEDTYRFGFHCLTVGRAVTDVLVAEYGAHCDVLEFGCDRDVYRVTNPQRRQELAFYGKPGATRRGYALGVLAVQELHRRRPEVPVHVFGVRSRLPFPARRHAHLPPAELAALYNRCAAGLSLSFTNVSLVPYELLACGAVAVVNDDPVSRAVLESPDVAWSRPTPSALADALEAAVDGHGRSPEQLASGLGDLSWDRSRDTLVRVLEEVTSSS